MRQHLLPTAPIYFKRMRASKRLLIESVSHLDKKLFSPGLLDVMLYKLNLQDHRKMTCLKVRWFFGVLASGKSLPDILQDTEESD